MLAVAYPDCPEYMSHDGPVYPSLTHEISVHTVSSDKNEPRCCASARR